MSNHFDTYQFRCSALGKIVSKSGKFTETIKSYIEEVFIGEVYGVKKQISSKYFEKGLFEEETGITLLNITLYPDNLLLKNKQRKSNEFIHGEADCIAPDGIVYDIKNAWDLFTFGKAELTHEYKWQLVGYMWLWKLNKARLYYCLNNTPEHLLVAEEKKMFWSGNYISDLSPEFIRDCNELREKHNYDKMSLEERFKVWNVERVDDEIKELQDSIIAARKYMNQLWDEHNDRIVHNRELMGKNQKFITLHDENVKVFETMA